MFQRIFAAALGAGVGVGLLIALLQHVALVPLILEAETYESGAHHASARAGIQPSTQLPALVAQAQAHEAHNAVAGQSEEGNLLLRAALTTLTTTLTAVGFGLLLTGAFALSGRDVDAQEGLLWGIGGFAAFALAPAFGLPPELPGSVAAELVARQIWWVGTVAATAGALLLMVFARGRWGASRMIPLGIVLLIAPHVLGAPHPHAGAGVVPPELAASFAARSLAVNAVLWTLLGLAAGGLYARFAREYPV